MPRICVVPVIEGTGGTATFRRKFEAGLKSRGVEVTHDPPDHADAILLIAGTKDLWPLWQARRRGVRIVQRLDGINWVHRKRNTGIRHFLRAEYGNLLLSFIRSRIATRILYQSEFSRAWWESRYGKSDLPCSVVHNGVDLEQYRPLASQPSSTDRCRLLVVEGNLGGGYDQGLDNAVELAETLAGKHGFPMELMVVGKIGPEHRARVEARAHVPIVWAGLVSQERIPEIDRSAHLFFSADVHPACPNSVIESLACGLPVAAFDTGALKELVIGDAGRIAPYGSDPWELERPDILGLADAAGQILREPARFRAAARAHAETHLGLDRMVDGYLKALLEG